MYKKLSSMLIVTIMLFMITPYNSEASYYDDISQPRYLDSDTYGTFVIRTNKMYQAKADGTEKLVLNLGDNTTARNSQTGQTINDWRSFYITDATAGYFYIDSAYGREQECVLICGLVLIPDPNNKNQGMPADVFVLYYPKTGETKTLHINIGYPIQISQNQHDMKEGSWFEYLDTGVLFPRGIITQEKASVFVLSNAANLDLFNSANKAMLEAKGYNKDFFELVQIEDCYYDTAKPKIYSRFYGPVSIFSKEGNQGFRIPELEGKQHIIDKRLIVFRKGDNGQFVIASVGTDESDFCTAIEINIITKPEDEYYWIDRNKFLELAGMQGSSVSFGSTWTEKDMESYIDK